MNFYDFITEDITKLSYQSYRDVEKGGKDYAWAKKIEDKAKEIEKKVNEKKIPVVFKFVKMGPFDKDKGPIAEVIIAGQKDIVWDFEAEPEVQKVRIENRNWVGTVDEIVEKIKSLESTQTSSTPAVGTGAPAGAPADAAAASPEAAPSPEPATTPAAASTETPPPSGPAAPAGA